MARIGTSGNYYHAYDCPLGDCNRQYCNEHRFLYRDCDTLHKGWMGDSDVVNGLKEIYELGDCPLHEQAERRKANERLIREWEDKQKTLCEHGMSKETSNAFSCSQCSQREPNHERPETRTV